MKMTKRSFEVTLKTMVFGALVSQLISFQAFAAPADAKISSAKVEFLAETNVKLFRFKGVSEQVSGKAQKDSGHLKNIEVSVPVNSLKTGMDMRDKHMKERIFTKKDGTEPNVVFQAADADCAANEGSTCKIPGSLSIRGESRPQVLEVKFEKGGALNGKTEVKLSDYGIEAPSQAGVKVADSVKVEFSGKLE